MQTRSIVWNVNLFFKKNVFVTSTSLFVLLTKESKNHSKICTFSNNPRLFRAFATE